MELLRQLWSHLGITGSGVLGVVIAAIVLYLVYALILQVAGQRLSGSPSVLSFSVMAMLGALCARAMLGDYPTLLGALVAIATLLLLEALLGRMRGSAARALGLRGPRPTVVMIHGHVLPWQLRHHGLGTGQLLTLLRRAGIHRVADAELVILEARGTLTILRPGERIDADLVEGVRGAEKVPRSLLA